MTNDQPAERSDLPPCIECGKGTSLMIRELPFEANGHVTTVRGVPVFCCPACGNVQLELHFHARIARAVKAYFQHLVLTGQVPGEVVDLTTVYQTVDDCEGPAV